MRGGISVFFALFSLLSVRVVWLFVLTGTWVSVPCGQVNSVCIAIEIVDFWLRCVVAVVQPETTEAAVRLEEVFLTAQKGQPFWHLETKYLAPL